MSVNNSKAYSVLMSVYAKEKAEFLIESIDSLLAQTCKPSEIVIVWDGPLTPELTAVLETYQKEFSAMFRFVKLKENVGLGKALHKGVIACREEIIARMDSDDISLPNRMELELEMMEKHQADIVSGTLTEFRTGSDEDGPRRSLPEYPEDILRFAKRRNPFNHPCVMYKKESVLKAGNYQHFTGFEDYALWANMLKQGMKGYNIQTPILRMRTDQMQKRRGGIQYAIHMMHFRYHLYKIGFSSLSDFLISVSGHIFVSLLPSSLRTAFYKKVLRK